MVTCDEQASPSHTDKYAANLGPVVADLEEEERNGNDNDNSPEVDELGGKDCSVAICEDGEIIALDVTEG